MNFGIFMLWPINTTWIWNYHMELLQEKKMTNHKSWNENGMQKNLAHKTLFRASWTCWLVMSIMNLGTFELEKIMKTRILIIPLGPKNAPSSNTHCLYYGFESWASKRKCTKLLHTCMHYRFEHSLQEIGSTSHMSGCQIICASCNKDELHDCTKKA